MKRFILAFIAAYVFLFLWGWLLNTGESSVVV